MDKVVHFEISFDDLERAKNFYGSVFGWDIMDWEMPGGIVYTGIRTVDVDEKTYMPKEPGAINGGFAKRSAETPSPVITINVDSIDEAVKKIEARGGKMVGEKGEVPDMGDYAYFKDSEGNVMGLWETMKKG